MSKFKNIFQKTCSVVVIACFVILFGNRIMGEIAILSQKVGMTHYGIIIKGYEGLSILSAIGIIIAGWLVIKFTLWITEDDEQEIEELEKEEA